MLRTTLAAAAAAMVMGAAASAQDAFPDDAALQALIDERVADGRATGIVLGVMDADGTTRTFSAGDSGAPAPLGPDSVFEIGSITKVFTGTLLADMAQKGEVDPEAPAQDVAPEGLTLPERNGKAITLAHLSEQSSGLPRLPGNMAPADPTNPYADYDAALLHAFVSGYELPRDPGESFEYSNLGVGLLGYLLASHAGMTYEELVRTRVLEPLDMSMTGVALTPEMQAALAVGHDGAGEPASSWDIDVLAGAGGLRSTMTDMLKFLDANLGEPTSDLERAMRDAQTPRAARIGFNWITRTTPGGVDVVWHNGGTGGYRTFIGFDPEREIGVVLLSNQSTQAGVDDIGFHLLDPSMPLAASRAEVELTAEQMERFTGVYAFDNIPNFRITITLEGGVLMSQATGQGKIPVFPESETQVFARAVDAQLSLVLDAAGEVAGLVLHQNGAEQPATRIGPAPEPRVAVDVPAADLETLVGVYAMDAQSSVRFTVTREDGALFVQLSGQPKFPVYATSPTEFFYEVVDAQLTFVVNEDGAATGLILHQNGDHPATKVE